MSRTNCGLSQKQRVSLTQRIVKEIDSWGVRVTDDRGEKTKYSDPARALFYGIGIHVAQKVIEEIRGDVFFPGNYLRRKLKGAVELFSEDMIKFLMLKYQGNYEDIGKALGSTGTAPGRVGYAACSKTENISEGEKKLILIENIPLEKKKSLEAKAAEEISYFNDFVEGRMVREYVNGTKSLIAKKLTEVALAQLYDESHPTLGPANYEGRPLQIAQAGFRADWIKEKMRQVGCNVPKVCKAGGISEANLKRILSRAGTSVKAIAAEYRA